MTNQFTDIQKLGINLQQIPELQQHVSRLIDREQQLIRERLERESEKEERIKQLEVNFVKWADNKTKKLQSQVEKASKGKEKHIEGIVKKCSDHSKFVVKKLDEHQKLRKKSMVQAWAKANKLNEQYMGNHQSKVSNNRSAKTPTALDNPNSKSVQIEKKHPQSFTDIKANKKSVNFLKQSLYYQNNSNLFGITQYEQIPLTKQEIYHDEQIKIAEAKNRCKTKEETDEKMRIQEMGEKLEKIGKYRASRKDKMKRNLNKTTIDRESQDPYFTSNKKNDKKQANKIRVHSEYHYKPEPRVKDHSTTAKNKREQLFEQHLIEGNRYMENIKIKHLKTVLAKNIAYRSIEKKLFLERLHS